MEHSMRQSGRRRRHRAGALITALWFIPCLALMVGVGFLLAPFIFASRLLANSKVQNEKPQPVRLLSTDEYGQYSKDQASRVWTEGVRQSDIPKLEDETSSRDSESRTKHTRTKTQAPEGSPTPTEPFGNPSDANADKHGDAEPDAPAAPEPPSQD